MIDDQEGRVRHDGSVTRDWAGGGRYRIRLDPTLVTLTLMVSRSQALELAFDVFVAKIVRL